ncbi:hypothetical protein THAOC_02340 [Thalassiosira oceanica]|uniref:Uncharacterized protein n=1 Tax=Thalassiosira oceanica TaxID=159749 RepID=K0TAX5_THAOC|nr:hypothetical protein THAOC_02340 [Thalassiosira oceanica]|eukprot:EJK75918.1 hypothetical protein THAOC_02340 [Thalassiosira oceanica]
MRRRRLSLTTVRSVGRSTSYRTVEFDLCGAGRSRDRAGHAGKKFIGEQMGSWDHLNEYWEFDNIRDITEHRASTAYYSL